MVEEVGQVVEVPLAHQVVAVVWPVHKVEAVAVWPVHKAAVAVDPAEIQKHYSRLQHVLTRDVAMCWLFERQPMFFYNKRLKNVIMGPNGPADGFGAVTLA